MISKLFIPKLGMTMEKATIAEWRYRHGDRVEKDAPVVVIDTEKVANELEAPAAGRLVIVASVGEELPCGAIVGFIAETDEEFAEAARSTGQGAAAQVASSQAGEPPWPEGAAPSAGGSTSSGAASPRSSRSGRMRGSTAAPPSKRSGATTTSRAGSDASTAQPIRQSQPSGRTTGSITRPSLPRILCRWYSPSISR